MNKRRSIEQQVTTLALQYAPNNTKADLKAWLVKNIYNTYQQDTFEVSSAFRYRDAGILYVPCLELWSVTKPLPDGSFDEISIYLEPYLKNYGVRKLKDAKTALKLLLEDFLPMARLVSERIEVWLNC